MRQRTIVLKKRRRVFHIKFCSTQLGWGVTNKCTPLCRFHVRLSGKFPTHDQRSFFDPFFKCFLLQPRSRSSLTWAVCSFLFPWQIEIEAWRDIFLVGMLLLFLFVSFAWDRDRSFLLEESLWLYFSSDWKETCLLESFNIESISFQLSRGQNTSTT